MKTRGAPKDMAPDPAKTAYSGYHKNLEKPENAELTHVSKGTSCGEYLRRFWHPVMLSSQVQDLPKRIRILGEDFVLFRDKQNRLGCLDLHCSHRGASLEFGVITERGISCCYHGWLYDVDGTILATPAEPSSRIRSRVWHGAYPVREHGGLIFCYFGPVDEIPPFFVTDAAALEGNEFHPYYLPFPCNWLQAHENSMDPMHSVFLHTRLSGVQFSEAFGVLPVTTYKKTELGVITTSTRRIGDLIWVRINDALMPNLAQFGPPWEDGSTEKLFVPPAITRWIVPVDDTNCITIGWRHFNAVVDPDGRGRSEKIGFGSVDFVGQTADRPYSARQKEPGDYDAQVSQRPIAVHALENLATSDAGIALLRRNLRQGIAGLANKQRVNVLPLDENGILSTYAHDTVLRLPARGNDDNAFLAEVGEAVTTATLSTWSTPRALRREASVRYLHERHLC
jgi:nitrite reductase/ring-hydroxylating ferredoxin subunit